MADKYQHNKPPAVRLFDFLDHLTEEQIYYLLKTEKETVMALAIDQVDASKRNSFLSQLAPDAKNAVIKELGNLKSIPLEMVVNIAKELEKLQQLNKDEEKIHREITQKINDDYDNLR